MINSFILILFIKTNLTSRVGNCAGAGTSSGNLFYCGTGQNCNQPNNITCWDPASGSQIPITCSSTQYQCMVSLKNIESMFQFSKFKK